MKRPLLIALFGLAGTVAAVVLALFWGPNDEPAPQIPGMADSPQFLKPPTPLEPSQARPAGQQGEAQPSGPDQPPVFDVVRINPKGDTLIAGRASPGAEVTILDGEKVVGKVMADNRGEWVFIPREPLSPGKRHLKLSATTSKGVVLESAVQAEMVVPTRDDGAGSQGGGEPGRGNLSMDLIEDEKSGHLALSGQATPKGTLQIFLDNRLLGRVEADAKGRWALKNPLAVADSKMHVFRADELGVEGRVQARIELPYMREELMEDFARPNVWQVKSGQTLEKIALEVYGDKAAAKAIYEVNKNQLRTPSSLVPGQILFLPGWP
ncbi:MAG: LysM peptidoglycan-binding domain-containing protein [Alphaproteobacteria bacterium]|nr:LysM peptidoglycan-binding domain-containing protein [Alphaproteobacteria bacterium]